MALYATHFPAQNNKCIFLLVTSIKNAHNSFLVFKNKLDTVQGTYLADGTINLKINKTALKKKYIYSAWIHKK